ncbi:hypothetical protein ABK040_006843 [Willaertia magna]
MNESLLRDYEIERNSKLIHKRKKNKLPELSSVFVDISHIEMAKRRSRRKLLHYEQEREFNNAVEKFQSSFSTPPKEPHPKVEEKEETLPKYYLLDDEYIEDDCEKLARIQYEKLSAFKNKRSKFGLNDEAAFKRLQEQSKKEPPHIPWRQRLNRDKLNTSPSTLYNDNSTEDMDTSFNSTLITVSDRYDMFSERSGPGDDELRNAMQNSLVNNNESRKEKEKLKEIKRKSEIRKKPLFSTPTKEKQPLCPLISTPLKKNGYEPVNLFSPKFEQSSSNLSTYLPQISPKTPTGNVEKASFLLFPGVALDGVSPIKGTSNNVTKRSTLRTPNNNALQFNNGMNSINVNNNLSNAVEDVSLIRKPDTEYERKKNQFVRELRMKQLIDRLYTFPQQKDAFITQPSENNLLAQQQQQQ